MAKSEQSNKDRTVGAGTPAYGMGVLGALVYFMTEADGLLEFVWGFVLALFWPAVLVYEALGALVGEF